MAHGGASKNVIGVYQPYSYEQLAEFINLGKEDKCVTTLVAEQMCEASYTKFNLDPNVITLGCTAVLKKNGVEREGRVHEAFICVKCGNVTEHTHVPFYANINRYVHEVLLAEEILKSLYRFCNNWIPNYEVPEVSN